MRVPPTNNAPPAAEQQQGIPVIVLGGCRVHYQKAPDGTVLMMIGPVVLALPFSPDAARVQADQMRAAASSVVLPTIGPPSL